MESPSLYLILADSILILHVLVVFFVVFGLIAIYVGKVLTWSWVRNPWFRLSHVIAISVVALQSWLGVICPLTTWEMSLRDRAGDVTYSGSFIEHWLGNLLYYQAPSWVFTAAYTLFGLLVLISWFLVRPRPFGRS